MCVTIRFFLPGTTGIITDALDYVVDAIDTISGKIEIIMQCNEKNIPVISSMGTGNKLDPSQLEITDIYKTSVCPLAKVMRKELKERSINILKSFIQRNSRESLFLRKNRQRQK